jgi:hypothetical protein
MDEATVTRKPHLARLAREMADVIAMLGTIDGFARAAE